MNFRETRLTPVSNKKWSGMRIMIPEHVAMIREHRKKLNKRIRPTFDDDYLNDLARKISEAVHEKYTVSVNVYDEYNDTYIAGVIVSIDQQLKQLRADDDNGDPTWIKFNDILSTEKC